MAPTSRTASTGIATPAAVQLLGGFLTASERAALAAHAAAQGGAFVAGRQRTGYQKLALRDAAGGDATLAAVVQRARDVLAIPESFEWWDAWLLYYPEGTGIPLHRDPPEAEGVQHVRLNAIVRAARAGGVLVVDDAEVVLDEGDAVVFRPDVHEHAVSVVDVGDRLVFSVGAWLPVACEPSPP